MRQRDRRSRRARPWNAGKWLSERGAPARRALRWVRERRQGTPRPHADLGQSSSPAGDADVCARE
eukprot:1594395-Pyramimonas_sp.AAC.1